ncbi:MAG: CPBP family intramembrane metalloprotease [Deltaproteobacteria bacterium]|nr:CPBP family intramembrane metalloprotease [Deltaproteobacteria bacterium]
MLTRAQRFIGETLDHCDRQTLPPGRVSPRTRVMLVYLVGSLVLTAMAFGVLSGSTQEGMADALISAARTIDPDLAKTLEPYRGLLRVAMWTTGALAFYFVLPAIVVRRVFGHRLADYGLTMRGFGKHLPFYLALFLPVGGLVLVVAASPDFQSKYPLYKDFVGLGDLLAWELLYGVQFFALEFFFRGFLVHGVKDRMGVAGVVAMVMPYVMIHFSKPLYEAVGAIVAGTVLGLVSLRTGSIAGGVFIHIGVAWTMDAAALAMR